MLRLLDALGIERASVVGASFGGRVALELASTWPERVERLVLLCSAWEGVDPDPALASFAAEENRLLDAGDVNGAVELNVRTWLGPDASDATRSLVERMQRRAFEVQLEADDDILDEDRDVDPGAVRARALMVSGALDFPRFRQIAAALADRIPGGEHLELDWAGHLPSLERPDSIDRAAPAASRGVSLTRRRRKPSSCGVAADRRSARTSGVRKRDERRRRPQMRRFAGAEEMAGRGCGRQGVHTARAHACASVAREGCRRDRPRRRDWPGTSLEISLIRGF